MLYNYSNLKMPKLYSIIALFLSFYIASDKTHIYGRGKDATVRLRNNGASQYFYNYLGYKRAHSHPDDNNYR